MLVLNPWVGELASGCTDFTRLNKQARISIRWVHCSITVLNQKEDCNGNSEVLVLFFNTGFTYPTGSEDDYLYW